MKGNIDQQEIAKFDALSSRWWDKQGEFKSLHDINPIRLSFIQNQVDLNNKSVIDVGCGGGILSEAMAQQGAKVTGIDMGQGAIETAKLHLLESGFSIDYQQISAEDKAQQAAGQYDVVTCLELIEHVPDPASLVNACAKLAKPGGKVIFSTINRNPKAYLFAILGAEYILQLLPKGTHNYANFIRPSELDAMAQSDKLEISAMAGMGYNPITKVYKLTDDTSVNYLAAFDKL